jgi:hypothetical protein
LVLFFSAIRENGDDVDDVARSGRRDEEDGGWGNQEENGGKIKFVFSNTGGRLKFAFRFFS